MTSLELSCHLWRDCSMQLLLRVLGWDLATDKDGAFGCLAKVLGLEINLKESGVGRIFFSNTEARREELFESISKVLSQGSLSRKEGEKLRGRLQFAEAQISGRQPAMPTSSSLGASCPVAAT